MASRERLDSDSPEIRGMETLIKVADMNQEGLYVIFAPNHVIPHAAWREQSAFAEDYPKFKRLLEQFGIDTTVLFRGDGDIDVGDSKVMEMIYDFHRVLFSALGKAYTGGGIPLAINAKAPEKAMKRNYPRIREIFESLQERNVTIYPYGNWFQPREQAFESAIDLTVDGSGNDNFVSMDDYENWRKSLKSGFIRIAKRAGVPIVPVYIDNTDGNWSISFGDMIEAGREADNVEVGKTYLQEMREMRYANLLPEERE